MTFLYKVNRMGKDEKKGRAFRKLTVISIKTVKRASQMTIKGAGAKFLMR